MAAHDVSHRRKNTLRNLCALAAALIVSGLFVATAQAMPVEYLSQHPVPHKYGGGFCTIEVPHTHNYSPDDPRMYREHNGQFYFVGDPAPFEYDGPRFSYYGAHPVMGAEVHFGHPIYCYIKGPHFHGYQPSPQAQFQLSGGAYWYVGTFPRAYYDERPRYAVINEAYAPLPYVRPVVDVQFAPPMVRAEISVGGPGWSASAMIGAPPAPVYVAPPAPVIMAPPAPVSAVQIGVGINFGGPAAVIERREYIEERRYHDRGRREDWREDRGRREGWHDGWHERRPPQARFTPARAPVNQPLFQRAQPQRPGPGPRSVPAGQGRRDDHHQDRRH